MFNRPISPWLNENAASEPGWDVDRNPQFRLVLLWIGMLVPVLVICGRVAQLQLSLQDDFASAFSLTSETIEVIPARDGRILAAGGSVLADNSQQFDIAVHYPAIQDPPDDAWITAKAKPRLSKSDRRDKIKLAAEKQKVISENDRLWARLAKLTDRSLEEVLEARRKEQVRVELIKESVHRRHIKRQAEEEEIAEANVQQESSAWIAMWQRIQRQLERPRKRPAPRLISEELDYHTVITNVSADIKDELEAHRERYPYTRVLVRTRRTYPRGELASHLIGFRKPLTEEQLQERRKLFPDGDPQDYRVGDPCGQGGLEQNYDALLKGVRGQRLVVKNRRGEIIETRVTQDPRHGHDLNLTLDAELQQQSERLIDEALNQVTVTGTVDPEANHDRYSEPTCPQGGCLLAMDIHTGAIIAAASGPRIDANLLVSADAKGWDDVMSDPRSPMLSRVTKMALPPGSVFKVISAIAAVESGAIHPDASFYCQGYLDRPDRLRCLPYRHQHVGHGDVTLADALCRSCNVYFFAAARRMGPQALVNWSTQFGIGQPTGIDLPSESAGHLPSPDSSPANGTRRQSWRPGDTLGLAIGQAELLVTPLQMVRMMAAVANNGYLVTPRLAAHSGAGSMQESDTGHESYSQPEAQPIAGLHRSTLDHVRLGLTMVVHDSHGTGYKTIRMKEVTIAGKTGTAENNGVDHAWFAGYVPAEQPRIAFVVVLQNGGSGGKVAGPVAHKFVKALIEMDLITKKAEMVDARPQRAGQAED